MAAEVVVAAEGITAAKAKEAAAKVAAAAAAGGAMDADGRRRDHQRRHTWAGEQLGRLQATLVSEKPFKLITRSFRLDMSQAAWHACISHRTVGCIVPAQGSTSHPCIARSRVVYRTLAYFTRSRNGTWRDWCSCGAASIQARASSLRRSMAGPLLHPLCNPSATHLCTPLYTPSAPPCTSHAPLCTLPPPSTIPPPPSAPLPPPPPLPAPTPYTCPSQPSHTPPASLPAMQPLHSCTSAPRTGPSSPMR